MYAIIETGGKQYKVSENDIISVEKLPVNVGETIKLNVLALIKDGEIVNGNPTLKNAEVIAEVVEHGKAEKITIFKYKAKKNYKRKQGHRQPFTSLKITSVK